MVPTDHDTPLGSAPVEPPRGEPSIIRRRLLRGGLTAAPVLFTVKARAVMAGGPYCVAPSSFTSLNMSGDNHSYPCSGRTPGFWKQEQKFPEWPAGYYPVKVNGVKNSPTMFNAVFGVFGGYPGKSLLEVLGTGGNDLGRDALARHIVAALLNAAKGWTPDTVLSVSDVKSIWAAFVSHGYYEPTAGVKWYADYSVPPNAGDGIIAYLKSTMPL